MNEITRLIEKLDMLTAGCRTEAADALGVSKVTFLSYRQMELEQSNIKYSNALIRLRAAVERLAAEKGVRFEE